MDISTEIRQRKSVSTVPATTNISTDKEDVKKSLSKSRWEISDLVMSTLLLLLSLPVRFKNLASPSQVIFDESHFGKFAGYYIKHSFFYDVHPPVSKFLPCYFIEY